MQPKNSLLWQEILMVLSLPQPLHQFHETFHGLKSRHWFIIWHGSCLDWVWLFHKNLSCYNFLVLVVFLNFILLLCCSVALLMFHYSDTRVSSHMMWNKEMKTGLLFMCPGTWFGVFRSNFLKLPQYLSACVTKVYNSTQRGPWH